MMWYGGPGYGWGMAVFGILMMVVFWGVIAAAIVLVMRSLSGSRLAPNDTAMETLRRRLAAGEITTEEFERISKALHS